MTEIEIVLFVMTIILFIWNMITTFVILLLYRVVKLFIDAFTYIFNKDEWWDIFIK